MILVFFASPAEELWNRYTGHPIYVHRNYYGIMKVTHFEDIRLLFSGTTVHGGQSVLKEKEDELITYFHKDSPVNKLFKSGLFAFDKVGVLGLGIGNMAAFVGEGQRLDYFEIDPDVPKAADFFTYLKKSKARISIAFGDGRVCLENSPVRDYDILIADAFNGDAIPEHLLTIEGIKEYRAHLKDNGMILFHVSNRYVDIVPVLFGNAQELDAFVMLSRNRRSEFPYYASTWVIFTWDPEVKDILTSKLGWKELKYYVGLKAARPWTDDYSNVLSTIKVSSFLNSIKRFQPFSW
jgi:hypothetical protein